MFDVVSVDTLHSREICEDILLNLYCRDSKPKHFTRTLGVFTADSSLHWQRNTLSFYTFSPDKSVRDLCASSWSLSKRVRLIGLRCALWTSNCLFWGMPQSKRHVELARDISTINSIYSSDTMALGGVLIHSVSPARSSSNSRTVTSDARSFCDA